MMQALWKTYGGSSNSETEFPYDTAIPILDMYPKELKAGSRRDNAM